MSGNKDHRDIMFFAFRYSLGRKTFAPYIVTKYIKEHIDEFSSRDYEQMANEIDERKRMFGEKGLGDPMIDEPDWIAFRDYLREKAGTSE